MNLSQIVIGGPGKISDNGTVIYTAGDIVCTPKPVWRGIDSGVGGVHDGLLVDLVWEIAFTPKSIWSAGYRAALVPTAYTNFTSAGSRLIGAANRSVIITGTDSQGMTFNRCCLTKMPDLFFGLGQGIFGDCVYTGFIKTSASLTDADAFYTENATAWDQSDYPTAHQEAMCTAAWGAVSGWTSLYAEEGFKIAHDFVTSPVKQGNVTVDMRIQTYRPKLTFKPQQPTTAQILTAFGGQGTSLGIGRRQSGNAADFVITGSGVSATVESASMEAASFIWGSSVNRHGEITMTNALTAPGDRLTLA